MKILFLISTVNNINKGIGGHYYSLLTIAGALSEIHDVRIVHIGTISSVALHRSNIEVEEIISPHYNTVSILSRLNKLIRQIEPEILHSFDISSHFFSRIISFKYKIPNILTQCGGRNPKVYYPYTSKLILFSKENELYFKMAKKFKETKLYLIPNRAGNVKIDEGRIKELKEEIDIAKYEYIILRITRIGKYYKKINQQLIDLLKSLREQNVNCCLVFIGVVEDTEIKELLLSEADHVFVVDDQRFTKNARELLAFADIVHGTGRSFMEASSLSKIMLVPTENLKYPVLFTKDNYIDILNQNISGRYVEKRYDNSIVNDIANLLKSVEKQSEIKAFSREVFEKYFDVHGVVNYYTEIYESANYIESRYYFDLLLHYLFVKKSVIRG